MPEPTSATTPKPPNGRRRLLLVDDNAEGRRALARLLEFYHYEVTPVPDGASAFRALEESPPPDVVLTDLLLPDLDGREVARRASALVPTPIIILITGWDFEPAPEDCEGWGIDHVFLKPLNVGELVATLEKSRAQRG